MECVVLGSMVVKSFHGREAKKSPTIHFFYLRTPSDVSLLKPTQAIEKKALAACAMGFALLAKWGGSNRSQR